MTKIQRKAYIRLIAIGVIIVVSAVLLVMFREKGVLNVLGMLGFLWIFAIPGLMGPPPFVPFRKKKGQVIFDERDTRILQRATADAFGAFWYVFPILCLWLYLLVNVYRTEGLGMISSAFITIMAGGGGILVVLVQSVSIIIQYREGQQ